MTMFDIRRTIALALGFTLLSSAAGAAGLFDPATATEMRDSRPSPAAPGALRSRLVRLNTDELARILPAGADRAPDRLRRARGLSAAVTIDLFPGLSVRAERTDVDAPEEGGFVWSGKGTGHGDAFVTLVVNDGEVLGHVQTGGKLYSVEQVSGEVHRIIEIDQSKIRGDIHLTPPATSLKPRTEASPSTAETAEAVTEIRVMVAHTVKARQEIGTSLQMQNRINQAIALANKAFLNSGVHIKFRRVGGANEMPATYNEARLYGGLNTDANYGNLLCDLTGVTGAAWGCSNNRTGVFADLRTKRTTVGADLVILMRQGGAACGIAWLGGFNNGNVGAATAEDESIAYSIVTSTKGSPYNCIEGNTLAHEAGHNMGMNHDRTTDDLVDAPSSQFNFGYINKNAKFATVMAYGSTCDELARASCARIPFFSTPLKTYNGRPVGVAAGRVGAADGARRLNLNRGIVAGWR